MKDNVVKLMQEVKPVRVLDSPKKMAFFYKLLEK